MVKKKSQKATAAMEPGCPLPVEKSSKIDYEQPLSSPYEGSMTTLVIGGQQYSLPDRILRQIPRYREGHFIFGPTTLSDIHEDVAHTFVHFLYTGNYQTINIPFDVDTSAIAEEYRKAVSVYQAARVYELPDLESLAKHYIEIFGDEITMYDMLRITRDVFSALPEHEDWLPNYIERSLQQQLKIESPGSNLEEVYQVLGQIHEFDISVMKMVVRVFSAYLKSINDDLVDLDEVIHESKRLTADCAVEAPPKESIEYSFEKPVEQPVEDPEPAAVTAEEPAEEVTEEPYGFPTAEPAEGWSLLQKFPSTAEGYAGYPHPTSDVPAAQDPSIPKQPAFENPLKTEPVLVNLSTVSETDLALYEKWGELSPKMRHKRKKKLRAKGLPIPSEVGAITFYVG